MKTIEKHGKRNIYIQLKAFAPFFILLFLNLLFYGNFLLEHYAADTYFSKAAGWKATAENYFSGGRWLMYAFCHLCDILHISFQMELFLSWLIAIISVSLSSLLIYHLLKDRICEERVGPPGFFYADFQCIFTRIFYLCRIQRDDVSGNSL
jgi:hypothetical protein